MVGVGDGGFGGLRSGESLSLSLFLLVLSSLVMMVIPRSARLVLPAPPAMAVARLAPNSPPAYISPSPPHHLVPRPLPRNHHRRRLRPPPHHQLLAP